jgi:hypothetical protein
MFDLQYRARLTKVVPYVKETLAHVERRIEMTLTREFESFVAAGIGKAARDALEALKAEAMISCKLPITAFVMKGTLKGAHGNVVALEAAKGITAVAKKGKEGKDGEDNEPPSIDLTFDLPFTKEIWLFLGEEFGGWADVELRKVARPQRELFGDDEGEEAKPAKEKPTAVPPRSAS